MPRSNERVVVSEGKSGCAKTRPVRSEPENVERPSKNRPGQWQRWGAVRDDVGWRQRGLGAIFVLRPQPVMLPPMVSGVGSTVRFTSMPGSTHRLQRAGTLGGNWLTLTNLLVPTNGVAEFTDPPSDPSAFYRTVAP